MMERSAWRGATMGRRRAAIGIALMAILVAACSEIIDGSIAGVDGSGTAATEARDVTTFDAVVLRGSGTAIIDVGPSPSLAIEADDNLLAYLTSEVEDGALVLASDRSIDPVVPIVYRITVPELGRIEVSGSADVEAAPVAGSRFAVAISGSGDVDVGSLDVGSVDVSISGSGSVTLVGASVDLDIAISGSGDVRAADLATVTANVDIAGSGGVVVNAASEVTGSISGSGDVVYLGSPTVDVSETGSGNVSQR